MSEYSWLDLMAQNVAQPYDQGPPEPVGSTLGGLSLGGSKSFLDSYTDNSTDSTSTPTDTTSTPSIEGGGYTGGGSSSGWGPSSYGYTGTTGLSSNRGTAKYGLQKSFWSELSAAFADMRQAGLGTPGVTDGFRSLDAQYDVKARKGALAATPGHSVHGLGLAADLSLTGAQQRWLERNGARYGLGRLPSEAWHWQLLPSAYRAGGIAPAKPQPKPKPAPVATNPLLKNRPITPSDVFGGFGNSTVNVPQKNADAQRSAHQILR